MTTNSPLPALYANVTQMAKAWRTLHDSTLGYSWKKMWPISLLAPQPDFARNQRLADQICSQIRDQIAVSQRLATNHHENEQQRFLKASQAYLLGLEKALQALSTIAGLKQKRIMAKGKISLSEANAAVVHYKELSADCAANGEELRLAFRSLPDQGSSNG